MELIAPRKKTVGILVGKTPRHGGTGSARLLLLQKKTIEIRSVFGIPDVASQVHCLV